LAEGNWHKENWELGQRVTRTEGRVDALEDRTDKLEGHVEKIFGKVDGMRWQIGIMVGIGIAVQVLLNYVLPGK
jgi:tetrahydromethanopterin S-methyltransferase subunit G